MAESISRLVRQGRYLEALLSEPGRRLLRAWAGTFFHPIDQISCGAVNTKTSDVLDAPEDVGGVLAIAAAALNAFLQINVTGPAVDALKLERVNEAFGAVDGGLSKLTTLALESLSIDGVAPYPYITGIELFAFARWAFGKEQVGNGETDGLANPEPQYDFEASGDREGMRCTASWLKLRVVIWHYRLLVQPSPSGGSMFNKASHWSDMPTLQQEIENTLTVVEKDVLAAQENGDRWTVDERVLFLLEKSSVCMTIGLDIKASEALRDATKIHRFAYTLSGALGKRTRFQEKSISQLVVLAKSDAVDGDEGIVGTEDTGQSKPEALRLNDDTLLETIEFAEKDEAVGLTDDAQISIPPALKTLGPDNQPQLSALDQIILLSEATLKDSFSPVDGLSSEEILPFATRVLADKSTNWQIYTQALLVRSRIELHRSRTVERGVLQMQAVVDQVVVATTTPNEENSTAEPSEGVSTVPSIQITAADIAKKPEKGEKVISKPSSIFPAAKSSEASPAEIRLRYIHAVASPPRWHLESELAYAWAGVGSLVSALEIFRRLRLWAEVALCLAASVGGSDADRRESGEEKARGVVRWQLFQRSSGPNRHQEENENNIDASDVEPTDYTGPERSTLPGDAPRLFCILGDLENDPKHYSRAWEISKHRYARAQRSLGEYYLQQKDWTSAQDAYKKAVVVNRLNPELWNRLGDISLRLGDFSDAAAAYGRAVANAGDVSGGEDARTWSNLGSALYSLYLEAIQAQRKQRSGGEAMVSKPIQQADDKELDEGPLGTNQIGEKHHEAAKLLAQSLTAYKRGATIAHDNWRIWDNVLTLASRMHPPAVPDMLQALRSIISIRKSEDVLDVDVLRKLLNEGVLSREKSEPDIHVNGEVAVYDPPRGSVERSVCQLLEGEVAPLITTRSELWELLVRERVWLRDYAGAIDAAERAWRAATSTAGSGVVGAGSSTTSLIPPAQGRQTEEAKPRAPTNSDWLESQAAWDIVVERTDDLVSVLEHYGPEVADVGSKWKGKARAAIRSVMSRGRVRWGGSEGWKQLVTLLDSLKP
jgi:tetratricopeptide (TPR) repeat protein